MIGVSADPIKVLQSFRRKQKLNFLLLSDADHKMILGIQFHPLDHPVNRADRRNTETVSRGA